MDLNVERVDVWAAGIKDQPGGMAQVLDGLREAGSDLNFILARRAPDKPGTGVVFVTPLRRDAEKAAAKALGFNVTHSVQTVRVEGKNEPGIAAVLAEKLSAAGLNLRGFSAAANGEQFIMYIGLDSDADAAKTIKILKQA